MKKPMANKSKSIHLIALISIGILAVCLAPFSSRILNAPSYWVKRLGDHYVPNEIYGRSSRSVPVRHLKRIGPEKVVPAAIRLLSSSNTQTREGAADALTLFGPAANGNDAVSPTKQATPVQYKSRRANSAFSGHAGGG